MCGDSLFDVTLKCVSSPESTSLRGEGSGGAVCRAMRYVEDFLLCPCDCVLVGGMGSCLICVGVCDRLRAHGAMCVYEYAVKCGVGVGHLSKQGACLIHHKAGPQHSAWNAAGACLVQVGETDECWAMAWGGDWDGGCG